MELDHALSLAQAALARAATRDMHVSVAVIDSSFHMKAGLRGDAAGPVTLDIAYGKARTALAFNCSSRQIADALAGNPLAAPSVLAALTGPIVFIGGGVLVKDGDGKIIGAIGVAGSSPDNDEWAAAGA